MRALRGPVDAHRRVLVRVAHLRSSACAKQRATVLPHEPEPVPENVTRSRECDRARSGNVFGHGHGLGLVRRTGGNERAGKGTKSVLSTPCAELVHPADAPRGTRDRCSGRAATCTADAPRPVWARYPDATHAMSQVHSRAPVALLPSLSLGVGGSACSSSLRVSLRAASTCVPESGLAARCRDVVTLSGSVVRCWSRSSRPSRSRRRRRKKRPRGMASPAECSGPTARPREVPWWSPAPAARQ